jgi:hypothetical protein
MEGMVLGALGGVLFTGLIVFCSRDQPQMMLYLYHLDFLA